MININDNLTQTEKEKQIRYDEYKTKQSASSCLKEYNESAKFFQKKLEKQINNNIIY